MENENNHNKNHIFFKSEIRCQEKLRIFHHLPQTPGHKGTSLCEVHKLLCNPISAFIFKVQNQVYYKNGSGLIRGMAFDGSGLIRGMVFDGSSLIREGWRLVGVVYKRDGLWWEWTYKRIGLWWEWLYKRGDYCTCIFLCLFMLYV